MIIVAGGDSFVAGSELEHSDNNFTKLVSQQYTNYINVATPGNSNEAIARQTINALESLTKDKFAIVSWTFPGRYEFRFNYDTKQRTGHWYSINSWTIESDLSSIEKEFHTQDDGILTAQQDTIKRANETGVAGFAQTFYKHVGSSEYWEIYSTLKEIVYLQNYLKSNSIPYMFTCADNCILYNYTIENADVSIKTLYNLIDMNKWFWFPEGTKNGETQNPRGFYQWALENKYKVGTTHPLEDAHKSAANLMQEFFNDQMV